MIPTSAEFISSVRGAWRLFLWDEKGLDDFDLSIEGFWKSFFGPLAMAPIIAFIAVGSFRLQQDVYAARGMAEAQMALTGSASEQVAETIVAFLAGIALFPLLMIPVSRLIGLGHRYIPFIVAQNWATVVQTGLVMVVMLLYTVNLIGTASALAFTIVFAVFVGPLYLYSVARSSLQTTPGTILLVIALDFTLALLIGQVTRVIF